MNNKLYLECYSGISGDMTVAALLDLGANADKLRHDLDSLHLDGYSIEISRVKKSGLDACDFSVNLDPEHENHDHDMAFLHGEGHIHAHDHEHEHHHDHDHDHEHEHHHHHHHDHDHEHEHHHHHDHDHEHEHHHHHDHVHNQNHHHSHSHRGLPDIIHIIEHSEMTAHAKELALRIFHILAEAESKAHGVPMDQVHFHEVGAVDSIVDIAAVAICLDDLQIEDVIVPVLYEGCGYIRCQHGVIPVPVPATLNIVSAHHLPMHQTETQGEFVTPTGAAIVAAIRTEAELPARYTVERIGLGAGKRNYERPSILRAMLIAPQDQKKNNPVDSNKDTILKLECNVDDCTGEAMGYAMERLFAAGAKDVNYTPVFMKKNRPGYLISVICSKEQRQQMEEILFAETTTIGIRRTEMERTVLNRRNETIMTSFGPVEVKILEMDGCEKYTLEYESVARIAREQNLPFQQVYKELEAELRY